jgi:hypothetical protein
MKMKCNYTPEYRKIGLKVIRSFISREVLIDQTITLYQYARSSTVLTYMYVNYAVN